MRSHTSRCTSSSAASSAHRPKANNSTSRTGKATANTFGNGQPNLAPVRDPKLAEHVRGLLRLSENRGIQREIAAYLDISPQRVNVRLKEGDLSVLNAALRRIADRATRNSAIREQTGKTLAELP